MSTSLFVEGEKPEVSSDPLTVSMKATVALIVSFIIFFEVGVIGTLLVGPFDIDLLLSQVLLVPLFALLAFAWKGRPWAYLGSMIWGVVLVVLIGVSSAGAPEMSPLLMWETVLTTTLTVLIALEAFKTYTESRKP